MAADRARQLAEAGGTAATIARLAPVLQTDLLPRSSSGPCPPPATVCRWHSG